MANRHGWQYRHVLSSPSPASGKKHDRDLSLHKLSFYIPINGFTNRGFIHAAKTLYLLCRGLDFKYMERWKVISSQPGSYWMQEKEPGHNARVRSRQWDFIFSLLLELSMLNKESLGMAICMQVSLGLQEWATSPWEITHCHISLIEGNQMRRGSSTVPG